MTEDAPIRLDGHFSLKGRFKSVFLTRGMGLKCREIAVVDVLKEPNSRLLLGVVVPDTVRKRINKM
jgi:hypothetical protein